MTIKVVVRYEQKFWGKILTDTYTRLLDSKDEISDIYEALYEYPCVTYVDVEIIPAIPTLDDDNDTLLARAEKAETEGDEARAMVERPVEEIDKHKGGYPVAGDNWYGMGNLHALIAEWKEREK